MKVLLAILAIHALATLASPLPTLTPRDAVAEPCGISSAAAQKAEYGSCGILDAKVKREDEFQYGSGGILDAKREEKVDQYNRGGLIDAKREEKMDQYNKGGLIDAKRDEEFQYNSGGILDARVSS
ncbi:hypothetical protein MMC18_004630 [Xylographa bjoerkii]|nr:hypothetical protein [Xylographa bjoerkii]